MIERIEQQWRETRNGTPYEIWKWICPKCKQERSTLYIDGEYCHGHGKVASANADFSRWDERCTDCWQKEIEDKA